MIEDDDWPAEPFLGVGSCHAVSERGVRKIVKRPIGFVHFKDPPAVKVKRPKPKTKRRKR